MLLRKAYRACALGLLAALLTLASPAGAYTITIDLDSGVYDTTPVPGPGEHCPCDYLEDGARFGGFWAADVGTPGGFFRLGHTHLGSHNYVGTTGDGERQHAWTNDLQGNLITVEDGSIFSLVSVDYRIRKRTGTDPTEQLLPWTFGVDNVQMLVSTSFDPTLPDFQGQWTAFDIDDGAPHPKSGIVTPPVEVPWQTWNFTEFNNVSQIYLTNSAWVSFDNIVLEVVPEPSTGMLLGLGLIGLAGRRRQRAVRA